MSIKSSSINWTTRRKKRRRMSGSILHNHCQPLVSCTNVIAHRRCRHRIKIVSILLVFTTTIGLIQNGCLFRWLPVGLTLADHNNHNHDNHNHHNHHHHHHQQQRSIGLDDLDESNQQQQQHTHQRASWSQWWSYDGISGPDYWNINKHWRLCTLGRKQSPVNIRTDRLVYDHLLGPIQLKWHHEQSQQQQQQLKHASSNQLDAKSATELLDANSPTNKHKQQQQQGNVHVKLMNSGRGIEAWLESGEGVSLKQAQQGEHLHLAQGPLSYEYKLYKIELHSSSSSSSSGATATGAAADLSLSSNYFDNNLSTSGASRSGSNQNSRRLSQSASSGVASGALSSALYATNSSDSGSSDSGSNNNNNNLNKIDDNIMADSADSEDDNDAANKKERNENRNVAAADDDNDDHDDDRDDADGDGDEIVPGASSSLRASQRSSEHLIDGRSFGGEVQLHFYNKQLASSAQEALRLANEQPLASLFAVISVFISLKRQAATAGAADTMMSFPSSSSSSASSSAPLAATSSTLDQLGTSTIAPQAQQQQPQSEAASSSTPPPPPPPPPPTPPPAPLAFILDNLIHVQNQGDSIELRVARSQIESLVTDKRNYVTYQGSMNKPPCAENVDWILLNRALRLDASKFGQLFDTPNTNQDNIRPIRRLNGRLLRTTISVAASGGVGSGGHNSLRFGANRSPQLVGGGGGGGGGKRTSAQVAPISCGANQSKQHNCTASNSAQKYGNQRTNQHYYKQEQHGQQHCQMKPNYVYQFTYNKI